MIANHGDEVAFGRDTQHLDYGDSAAFGTWVMASFGADRPPPERERMIGYGTLAQALNALEAAVSKSDYIAGDSFTAADLYVGSHIGFGMMFGTLEKRPAFEKYWQRVSSRPAYKRANELDEALTKKAS